MPRKKDPDEQLRKEKYFFVSGEEWDALYIDGKLKCEAHKLDWSTVLRAMGVRFAQASADDYLIEHGSCPNNLADITFDKF